MDAHWVLSSQNRTKATSVSPVEGPLIPVCIGQLGVCIYGAHRNFRPASIMAPWVVDAGAEREPVEPIALRVLPWRGRLSRAVFERTSMNRSRQR